MTPRRARLAVLASGRGTTMEALADACEHGDLPARIVLVLSNRPEAPVLARARERGLNTCAVDHRAFASRPDFEQAMRREIDAASPDFIALAGFMRILTDDFVRQYYGSLLNIHPSLLPKYPGLDTHQRALDAGDAFAGSTVHFVTPELDAGPIILQARVAVAPGDTAESLAERVQAAERRIYPQALSLCIEGRARLQGTDQDGHRDTYRDYDQTIRGADTGGNSDERHEQGPGTSRLAARRGCEDPAGQTKGNQGSRKRPG